jgi:glycosyltransferase involved in cell wall biosynthesis
MIISIALITYNGEKYIREQLDSIFAQTIQDFELIVCDDCSLDSTLSILDEYAQKDNRVKIYKNEKNLGFLKNIEKAIKLCNGEFIALADQDDVWEKEHLQILYLNIGNNLLVCGDSLFVDKDNISLNFRLSEISMLKNKSELFLRLLIMRNLYQGAAMMFSKKFIDIASPFPDKIIFHDLWFVLCAMALDKFVYVPTVVIRHRRHSTNVGEISPSHVIEAFMAQNLEEKTEYALPLKKLPNVSKYNERVIRQSMDFFSNKKKLFKYHKAIIFWIKSYKILYRNNCKNKFLIRLWDTFFHYQLMRLPFKIKNKILLYFRGGKHS